MTNMSVETEQKAERAGIVGPSLLCATLAAAIWSTSFVGTKIAYASFPPITLGAARFVIAAVVLGILLLARREFVKVPLKDIALLSLSGVLGITVYFTMENIGLKLTTASNAAMIVASYPAITAALELIFYKVRLSWAKAAGIALAVLGVCVLSLGKSAGQGENPLAGNLLLVATGFVWAFYNFMVKKAVGRYPMTTVSFYQSTAGALAFMPLAFLERAQWRPPEAQPLLALLYLGVFCSVAAFMLYNYSLRGLSSGTAVTIMNLVPVLGVASSAIVLHETVQPLQLLGGAAVILGVILNVRREKRPQNDDTRMSGESVT